MSPWTRLFGALEGVLSIMDKAIMHKAYKNTQSIISVPPLEPDSTIMKCLLRAVGMSLWTRLCDTLV